MPRVVLVMVQVEVDVTVVVQVMVMLRKSLGLHGARTKQHHGRFVLGHKVYQPWLSGTPSWLGR